jgi:hypothetical protein
MAARIKLGLDMSISMTITITYAIKVTRKNKFKINTTFPFKRSLPSSLYGERGFVNPPNLGSLGEKSDHNPSNTVY